MQTQQELNSINRVMKAWGLGSLDQAGSVQALAAMVQDHEHFGELLRACEPQLRRMMYEAMAPNLRFQAHQLEWYLIHAKEHAEAMQFPTLTPDGNLKAYSPPEAGVKPPLAVIEVPKDELWMQCFTCKREGFFYGERKADAIEEARKAGWAHDELGAFHLCPNCLGEAESNK